MEKEFGVALFNRTTPLTLTYAGQRLLVRARRLLTYKDETYHELADIKDFTVGQLSIGLSHTRGRVILPHVLPAYRSRFPNIELNILEEMLPQLGGLLHGDVDLVIGMQPFRVENIETVPICAGEVLSCRVGRRLKNTFGSQVDDPGGSQEKCRPDSSSGLPLYPVKKGKPGAHHRGRAVRGSADFSQRAAGDGKYRDGCWLWPPREWESPSARKCLPQTGPTLSGAGDIWHSQPVFPEKSITTALWPSGTKRALYVPGHGRIHPNRQRNDIVPIDILLCRIK